MSSSWSSPPVAASPSLHPRHHTGHHQPCFHASYRSPLTHKNAAPLPLIAVCLVRLSLCTTGPHSQLRGGKRHTPDALNKQAVWVEGGGTRVRCEGVQWFEVKWMWCSGCGSEVDGLQGVEVKRVTVRGRWDDYDGLMGTKVTTQR